MCEPIHLNQRGKLFYKDFINLLYYANHFSKYNKKYNNINELQTTQSIDNWIEEFNNNCRYCVFYN